MTSPVRDGDTGDCSNAAPPRPFAVAVVSDLHLLATPETRFRGVDTRASLRRVLDDVTATRPDVLLLGGDLSHDGSEASYRALPPLLATVGCPWYTVAGNHDDPALLARLFGVERLLDDLVHGRWRVRGLTSAVPGSPAGRLAESARRRLAEDLAHSDHDWVVLVHHHPWPCGSPWIDASGLADAEAFLDLCASSGRVRAVVYGHIHAAAETRRGALALYATPSTALAFPHPSGDLGAHRGPTPVGWRRLLLHPDGRHETEVRWLPPA